MKKKLYNIIAVVGLTLAIIQTPLFYYYTQGLIAILVGVPFFAISLGITITFLFDVLNKKNETTPFHKRAVFIMIAIGTSSIIFGERVVENLDWKFRKDSRNEIVKLIKSDEPVPDKPENNFICKLDDKYFPPISNGGNEIAICKTQNNKITVEFFINRGFLDHYSAFIYSDNPEKIRELEESLISKKGLHRNKKLDDNWYRVSY